METPGVFVTRVVVLTTGVFVVKGVDVDTP